MSRFERYAISLHLEEISELKTKNESLKAVLIAYEQWEANLIMDKDCGSLNTMSEKNHDRMMEIQAMRNDVLGRFGR